MTHWCETCGQELPEGASPHDSTWLGAPGDEAGQLHHHARPGGDRSRGNDKRILGGLLALLGLWAAFVLVGRVVSPDAESAGVEEATAQADEGSALDSEPAEPDDTYQAADAAPNAPVDPNDLGSVGNPQADDFALNGDQDADALGGRWVTSLQVERLQRQLGRRGSEAMLAYESVEGVVLINLQAGTTEIADLTSGATTADVGLELLRAGVTTYGIDPDTLTIGKIVDDGSIVVTQAQSRRPVLRQRFGTASPESSCAGGFGWRRTIRLHHASGPPAPRSGRTRTRGGAQGSIGRFVVGRCRLLRRVEQPPSADREQSSDVGANGVSPQSRVNWSSSNIRVAPNGRLQPILWASATSTFCLPMGPCCFVTPPKGSPKFSFPPTTRSRG